jgi:gamma-glutamylcyclotransferase (GGCT)/AIG2-like uncharacterized protein YtfP
MKLFVYGTLKKGFCNHHVLGNAKFIGAYTTQPRYTMYDMGAYPAIRLDGKTSIVGEVYEINDLELVDSLEGYPVLYDRTEIETDFGVAWVYYFNIRTGQYYYRPRFQKEMNTGLWSKR